MGNEFSTYRFPLAWNPKDHYIYSDDPSDEIPQYIHPLMDAKGWAEATGTKGIGHDSAGGQVSDPLSLADVFFNANTTDLAMYDQAVDYLGRVKAAKDEPDRRKAKDMAGAIITSTDFTDFQNLIMLGQFNEVQQIKPGVLAGLFTEIPTPNLSGKFAQFDSDVRWTRNLGETMSPEPSGGTGTIVEITVPKHGAAVAITQRAEDVINGDNPFNRLVGLVQAKRVEDENEMVGIEVESNTAHTQSGVDFGSRSGTPPVSQTNPYDTITALIEVFEGLGTSWNLFISKGKAFVEFSGNDIIRGSLNPLPSQGAIDQQVSAFPLAAGVTWARDNKISSATAGWALNSAAIDEFRGATRTYTVANPDTETKKFVIKTHFQVKTMRPEWVYEVTGITA